ncbi:hypothetical protein MC7420_4036 [Coleofasciculus chthonoplastes PCC 7420]|uniref:Uncharacterized protein n=1 Tax=Coleofasciculus chthonoplastes PCC 7420 TaxID=118168 RepID=B4VUU3_9CYAN|nr:hypothetical protein [Coleofasciculus chthonoplastes]EDX74512.1 hypothetical protein MC7420_4036 [Coleofasciculus chthonoplastes PCC 7420]
MTTIGSYQVKVQLQSAGEQLAVLSPATEEEMQNDWTFNWSSLWQRTDFDCQNIVKLVYSGQVWGLVRYGLYPYPGTPRFLEIEQLEANPTSRGERTDRLLVPIGKWLIWYSTKVGLQYCSGSANDPLIGLVSLASAVAYYRDVIQMEYLDAVTIAPGEDGYAFRFLRTAAATFCQRHEREWGIPTLLES